MSRVARVIVPGQPHHVMQRGNRGLTIFRTDADRRAYLAYLAKYMAKYGLSLWAYCLMPDHVHLVGVPKHQESLGRALRDAHTAYALRFNRETGESGHVWQGRFFSCPLDEEHLAEAVRFVERNPVRVGFAGNAEAYAWSSAAAHCGLWADSLVLPNAPDHATAERWQQWLTEDNPRAADLIRKHTKPGRPCGSPEYVTQLEALLGRPLRPRKRGRKPKRPTPPEERVRTAQI